MSAACVTCGRSARECGRSCGAVVTRVEQVEGHVVPGDPVAHVRVRPVDIGEGTMVVVPTAFAPLVAGLVDYFRMTQENA